MRVLFLIAIGTAGACFLGLACAEEEGAPSKAEPEQKPSQNQEVLSKEKKGAEDEAPHETLYTVILASGERFRALKYVDFGDSYSIKEEQGQFRTLKKEEVRKIIDPLRPPAKSEPVRPSGGDSTKTAESKQAAPADSPKAEPKNPEAGAKSAGGQPSGGAPPTKKATQIVFVLQSGRREKAHQYFLQGDYYVLQSTGGYVVKVKKSEVVRIEE